MTATPFPKTFQFPEVRVVEASAGSGKTYALAKRYIQLLLNPAFKDEPNLMRSILAITFTNKAALEMKARILDFLKRIALGTMPEAELKGIVEPIALSPSEARAKSYVLMEQIIRQYNFFQVQTIDSFIKTLLTGCAFKTGLTAGFRIRTNSPEYLEYALDELIDTARGDKKLRAMFEAFLHNYIYLENRSGWFPKKDMLDILRGLFTQYNHYGKNFKASPISAEEIIKLKKTILKDIKSLEKDLDGEHIDKRFITSYQKFIREHDVGFDIDKVPSYFDREEPPVKKNGNIPDRVYKAWSEIHENLKRVCEEEAYSLFNPYVDIFQETMAAFQRISIKEDVLFLEELNRRAQQLFQRGDISIGELYYRLATRFRHYLLDEYQDTSRLQWRNIEPMALEALASGGSLFYVGDKKQAIYSFRGGEVELFDEVRGNLKDYNVQVEPLAKNWRSQKAIVDFNNAVFSFDNLRGFIQRKEAFDREKKSDQTVYFSEEDVQRIGQAFANSQQTYKPENSVGYVKVERLEIDKKGERDEFVRQRVISIIRDLRARFALSDIAILTHSNKEVEQVTGWLLAENISVESERTSNVRENAVIQELVCFLKFLDSPIDNLSFAQFILSETFSKAAGLSREAMRDFVFSLRPRVKNEKDFYIYMAFREKYPKEWRQFFEEFFKNVGLYPLYEMVVTIYNRFAVLKSFPQYQGFLMRFLELIKREEEERSGIASFLEYFEELEGEDLFVHVGDTDNDAVKVNTIHKSKGLEFPVVILPFLCMGVDVGEGAGDGQQSYVPQRGENEIELLRLKKKYYKYSDDLYEIYAREYKREFLNEINKIYVALTRPMHELYIFVSNKSGQSINPARFLIPEELHESGKKVPPPLTPPTRGGEEINQNSLPLAGRANLRQQIREGESKDNTLRLPSSDHHDWINYLEDEFAPFDQLKNRKQRLRGSVIHDLLSYVGNLSRGASGQFLQKALEEAVYKYPDMDNLKAHLKEVEKIIAHPALKPYLYIDDGEVQTEIEVVNALGHTKRLDRLIIKAKEVWIVDFKSSTLDIEEKYQKQVREYVSILSELYPKHQVRGFLVYLDKREAEEV